VQVAQGLGHRKIEIEVMWNHLSEVGLSCGRYMEAMRVPCGWHVVGPYLCGRD